MQTQSSSILTKASKDLTSEMFQCLQNCLDCFSVCNQTLQHCLEMGGKHVEKEHIQLLTDCVKICETSANFLSRNSENHTDICGVCAEICRACADSCSSLKDKVMEKCAEVCNLCADSCEKMSAH